MQIVDILALLVPNIWTAITQLCATAVLFFALYKLAYKPVKKILDARSEYEQNRLAEADALKKENEEMKKQMEAELAKADDKAVFEALSPALNDDFSDYSGHLSEGLNHHNLTTRSEIFQKLRDTYEAYEMDLLEQRKNR